MKKNIHQGNDPRGILKEEGVLAEVEKRAMKQASALQLARLLKVNELTQVQMAVRMQTSSAAVDRRLNA